jgi:non-heme chloroperoxidase
VDPTVGERTPIGELTAVKSRELLRDDRHTKREELIASGPFFGFNRPSAKVSQGSINSFWTQGLQGGHKNTFDSIKAFSETDFRDDLKKFDVPTLIVHGDDDQIVPFENSAMAAHKMIKGSKLVVYKGGPHGITDTHKEQLNADLLKFLRE